MVECPEDRNGQYYVCLKMYGGGMGDQIMRKCELMNKAKFDDLLEKEAAKERLRVSGEGVDVDTACYDSVHNGRPVSICHCSTDQCNGAKSLKGTFGGMALAVFIAMFGSRVQMNAFKC